MVDFSFAKASIDCSTKGREGVVMMTIQDHFLGELPQPFNQGQVWRIRRQEQPFDIQTLGQVFYQGLISGHAGYNKPLAPDCQKPTMESTMESKLIPLGNEKQGLVRQGVSREAPDGSILANPNRKPCQSFNKKGGLHGSRYFSKNWSKRS